ncbi:hypothetical protein SH449x_002677 [Pirellulaceae bacterium SH449]
MSEMVSPAEQVTRVATLLGRAVLRWKREKKQSAEISEIGSDSLPEGLEFSPVSSLSVTGQNNEATGLEETSSKSKTNSNNHVRGATNKDRSLDRRSDLATREQAGRATDGHIERADHATNRHNDAERQGDRR